MLLPNGHRTGHNGAGSVARFMVYPTTIILGSKEVKAICMPMGIAYRPSHQNKLANRPSAVSPISSASPRATPPVLGRTMGLIHMRWAPSRHS